MTSSPRPILIAPYVGEFGWELMNWQARVRWALARRRCEQAFLFCGPGKAALYGQLPTSCGVNVIELNELSVPGEANEDHRINADGQRIPADAIRSTLREIMTHALDDPTLAASAEWFAPDYRGTLWPADDREQTFVSLRADAPVSVDVVLVPRRRAVAPERNQPQAWWNDLAALLRGTGLRVETYPDDLSSAIRVLSSARLAVGALTGGLHLASLCECPHYVWGAGPERRWTRMGITNRQRYETVWNPLATPCIYDDCGWTPSVGHIVDCTRQALDRIGRADAGERTRTSFRFKWGLRRGLLRLAQSGAFGIGAPLFRKFVCEQLI